MMMKSTTSTLMVLVSVKRHLNGYESKISHIFDSMLIDVMRKSRMHLRSKV